MRFSVILIICIGKHLIIFMIMSRPKTIIADVCLWQKYTTAVHRHPDESFTQRLRPELHQMLNTSNYRNCLSNIGSQVQNISSSSPASSARVWLVKSLTSEMIASDTFSGVEMTSPSSVDTTDFSLTINFSAPIKSNYHYYIRDFQTATFINNPFFFKSIIWSLVIWGSGVVQEAAG